MAAVAGPPVAGTTLEGSYRRPMALYFTLLGISVVSMILLRTKAVAEVHVDLAVSVAMSLVVLVWSFASLSRIHRGLATFGRLWHYPLAIAMGVATWGLATLSIRILAAIAGIATIECTKPYFDAGYGWPMVILMLCIQPALFEELAFRGVILEDLRGLLGLRNAVIVSSLMFMVLHLGPVSFPHLLVVGLVLGLLRVRTGSLYPCMVMHFTHNLLAIFSEVMGW